MDGGRKGWGTEGEERDKGRWEGRRKGLGRSARGRAGGKEKAMFVPELMQHLYYWHYKTV